MGFDEVLPQRIWPYYSSYLNVCCNCSNPFFGPKRAPACWLCVSEETKQWWVDKNTVDKDPESV
jgi:hypothetical protein